MARNPKRRFAPLAVADMPRFSGIPTFMRLPAVEDPAEVDIALVGIPFDLGTTNRPGARHGPRALREASTLMRNVHSVTGVAPYALCAVADLGDVSINPTDLAVSLERIEAAFARIRGAGAVALAAGGDHLVSLPILRALARHRPAGAEPIGPAGAEPLGMVHVDAHSDTTDSYFHGSRLTHGTPFRRAIEEGLLDPRRIVQIGIRGSLFAADELDWAREQGVRVMRIEEVMERGIADTAAEARRVAGSGPCYLSFDIDSLDPAYAPGTGTPEIGGLSSFQAQQLLRGLRGIDFVGADLVEVSPPFDVGGMTAVAGATLMFEILCLLAERVGSRFETGDLS